MEELLTPPLYFNLYEEDKSNMTLTNECITTVEEIWNKIDDQYNERDNQMSIYRHFRSIGNKPKMSECEFLIIRSIKSINSLINEIIKYSNIPSMIQINLNNIIIKINDYYSEIIRDHWSDFYS